MSDARYPFRKSWRWKIVRLLDWFLDQLQRSNRRIPFPNRVRKILVVRLDQIGDVVCSLATLPFLKEQYPEAEITFLVGSEGADVVKDHPSIDHVLVYPSNWFSRGSSFQYESLFENR